MQLTYRGQSYNPSYTTIEAPILPLFGTYRGQRVTFTTPQPHEPITKELTYRGIIYVPSMSRPDEIVMNSRQLIQLRRDRQHPAFGN